MNANQENRFSMFLVLIDYLTNLGTGVLSSLPEFLQTFQLFSANVEKLRLKNEQQRKMLGGYRIEKTIGKVEAVNTGLNLAQIIRAYAVAINDVILQNEMKFTKSILLRKRDNDTAADLTAIIKKATLLQADILPYGATPAVIEKATNDLNNFVSNIPLPRASINARKVVTQDIKILFQENANYLKFMDDLVLTKRISDNEFYRAYTANRKVVNNHGKKLALRGTITDVNSNPIAGATVAVNDVKIKTKSTNKGYYEFKNLPKGMLTITFSRPGFVTQSVPVPIIPTERAEKNVIMQSAEEQTSTK